MTLRRIAGRFVAPALSLAIIATLAACGEDGTPKRNPPTPQPDMSTSDMDVTPDMAQLPDMTSQDDMASTDDMGEDMTTPGACEANPCREPNRSQCQEVNGQAVCSCDAGFVDDGNGQCVDADPCAPNPCQDPNRSQCQADANGTRAVCSCDAGYVEGQDGRCVPQDLCDPNPCQESNRSQCRVGNNNTIICSCDDGFSDVNGQCTANPVCGPDTCQEPNRSQCQAVNGQAVCGCDAGFVDNGNGQCVDADPCAPNPCQDPNRSQCSTGANNTAICSCDAGYVDNGGACVNADPCAANPCQAPNQSVCTNNNGQAVCSCDAGYQDDGMGQCRDTDPCDPNPCQQANKTECTVDAATNAALCGCDAGYQDDGMGQCVPIPPPTCNNQHATGDTYEPNECPSLATLITPGTTQQHTIDPAGDLDYFRFDVQAGEIMEFAETSSRDVVVTLYEADGVTVWKSSDSPEWLRREFDQAGTYYARVRHYSSTSTGSHTVSLTSIGFDDHGDDQQHASPLTIGQDLVGQVETGGDNDYFSFTTQPGHIYQVEESSSRDVVFYVYDSQGNLVRSTDSPEWLRFEATDAGPYYVRMRLYSTTSIGSYTLKVTDIGVDDHGDDQMNPSPITIGQDLTGQVEIGGDNDYFSFTTQPGHIYQVEETSSRDVIFYVYDNQGNLVRSTDSPEWLRFEALNAGPYVIRIRLYSTTSIGSYTLKITDIGLDDHGDDQMSASAFMIGQELTGQVEIGGDSDYFSFNAQAGHIFQIEETTSRDVYLYLYDAQGNLLRSTDSPEWMRWEFDQAGTYYVRIRLYSTSAVGSYKLKITDLGLDDHGDDSANATLVPLMGTQSFMGQVETPGDRDYFAFTVAAGQSVDLYETSSANVTLTLFDIDGTTIIQSITNPERLSRRFMQAGTYYLSVRYESSSAVGGYTLEITDEGQDDHGDGPTLAAMTTTDGTGKQGRVQFSGDQDWFTFTTGVGQVYAIKIEGFNQARATLYAPDGVTQLETRTNGTMFPQLAASTTYYVRVDSTSSSTLGTYTLTIND